MVTGEVGCAARAPAGPGLGPGPAGGRARLLPIGRLEVRAGPGHALSRAQAGPEPARTSNVRPGGRLRPGGLGFPTSGRRARSPPALRLFSPGPARVTLLPCLLLTQSVALQVQANLASWRPRAPARAGALGADRARGVRCLDARAVARLSGSCVAPRGTGCGAAGGLRRRRRAPAHFFHAASAPRSVLAWVPARAGPGPSASSLAARPLGVIELRLMARPSLAARSPSAGESVTVAALVSESAGRGRRVFFSVSQAPESAGPSPSESESTVSLAVTGKFS